MTYSLDKTFLATLAASAFFGFREGRREEQERIIKELFSSTEDISLERFLVLLDGMDWYPGREQIKKNVEMFFKLRGHKIDNDRNYAAGTFSEWMTHSEKFAVVSSQEEEKPKKKRKKKS